MMKGAVMVRNELHSCKTVKQYLSVAANREGYRSLRELFCNYLTNFGYTLPEFKLHMEYRHKVYYSVAAYRGAYYKLTKKIPVKPRQMGGFKYSKVEEKYTTVTQVCLGYRTFREALYCLIKQEGLNYRQIADLYGVSKGALQYRVSQERRIKSKPTF